MFRTRLRGLIPRVLSTLVIAVTLTIERQVLNNEVNVGISALTKQSLRPLFLLSAKDYGQIFNRN